MKTEGRGKGLTPLQNIFLGCLTPSQTNNDNSGVFEFTNKKKALFLLGHQINLDFKWKIEPGPGYEPRTSRSSLATYHLSYPG